MPWTTFLFAKPVIFLKSPFQSCLMLFRDSASFMSLSGGLDIRAPTQNGREETSPNDICSFIVGHFFSKRLIEPLMGVDGLFSARDGAEHSVFGHEGDRGEAFSVGQRKVGKACALCYIRNSCGSLS